MQTILRHDSPWLFGYYPKDFALYQSWYKNLKPARMIVNRLKYGRIESEQRDQLRKTWNQPVLWPLVLLVSGLVILGWHLRSRFFKREED